jgi:hypothetical protein
MTYFLSKIILLLFLSSCVQNNSIKELEKVAPFDPKAAKKSFLEYKIQIDKAKDSKKLKQKLREDIDLKKFNNEELEISEAELWYEGQNIVRIDVRYYDGAPIGTKHWYIKDSKPVGVTLAQFIQKKDDTIGEKLLYELVYDNIASKWHITDPKSKSEKDIYSAENNADWEILKNLAEKYKPKAE